MSAWSYPHATINTLAKLLFQLSERFEALEARLEALESKPPPPTAAPTPSSAPGPKAGPAPKKARAPRKAKTAAPTTLSATAIPSVNICSTTLQVAPVEKITVSVSIPDELAGHLIGREGTGLCQIHDISHAKMLVHPHSVSGAHVVTTRGSSCEVGDALTVIGKCLARRRVRTPKKKSTGTSTAAPPLPLSLGHQHPYPPQPLYLLRRSRPPR